MREFQAVQLPKMLAQRRATQVIVMELHTHMRVRTCTCTSAGTRIIHKQTQAQTLNANEVARIVLVCSPPKGILAAHLNGSLQST